MAKAADVFKFAVHPAARIFPMLPDDELDELAADIKANGLLHPVIVQDGVLIDGRNRLEACKRAGVEPRVQELNGEDAYAYIISSNVNRRHMTKGQRAMAVAIIYPEPEKGGRGKASKVNETLGFSTMRLSQARTVLRVLPEMAKAVLAGTISLDKAVESASAETQRASSIEKRMEDLAAMYPELASQVREGELSIDAAVVEARVRDEQAKNRRVTFMQSYEELVAALAFFTSEETQVSFNLLMGDPTFRAELSRRRPTTTLADDLEVVKAAREWSVIDYLLENLERKYA